MILMAGPCVIETDETALSTCDFLKNLALKYNLDLYFKSSFDKANRSSVDSYRGPGIEKGMELFEKVKRKFDVKIITDFHEPAQAAQLSGNVDMLQIPAFLCRQTDMLKAASESGLPVNVKKGQFLSPWDMANIVQKLESFGVKKRDIFLTERGTSFGYNNLVVDFRSFPVMRDTGANIIFDATHSLQLPGGMGKSSGGQREFVPYLAKAAAACGVDGFFMEIHPEPYKALCDGPNMLNFESAENVIKNICLIRDVL
ncbi:2-dehydro-3-deoxyphosphooctonate aldolase [Flexistipes sinusarabici DSM 4947]|uniref:3-deoxy-8-phosphooctulonate synthase n=1 Tax=Flexistipes sinusarabici (strain ATCC 49648 / DSM 4947 / MAS 10) TaxID=717231 RepID=F8E5E1_FLESM|nr:3-deoxy-8-phosphooctulonate synthase [Flexistipes sinusarabici]AEI14637.1 2-dehydro-3-deoxyphosphooctonate aldolase [Flexistipes sinusarabici DSM 4947]